MVSTKHRANEHVSRSWYHAKRATEVSDPPHVVSSSLLNANISNQTNDCFALLKAQWQRESNGSIGRNKSWVWVRRCPQPTGHLSLHGSLIEKNSCCTS